jgi:hypothetical protein
MKKHLAILAFSFYLLLLLLYLSLSSCSKPSPEPAHDFPPFDTHPYWTPDSSTFFD